MFVSKKDLEEYREYIFQNDNSRFFKKIKTNKRFKKFQNECVLNNKRYIDAECNKYKYLFDNINGYCLDTIQREIIVSDEDAAIIMAGAGSGKSLTIIGKVVYLLKKGYCFADILCLSFTNKACYNLSLKLPGVNVMTFHKLGMDILRSNGIYFNIVSDDKLRNVVDHVIKGNDLFMKVVPDFDFITLGGDELEDLKRIIMLNSSYVKRLSKDIVTFINLFKGNGYSYDYFQMFLEKNEKENDKYIKERNRAFLEIARKVYSEYSFYLKKNKLLDFNDMISMAIKIVKEKGIYDYKYIIIDEYQDTSLLKCLLIKAIKDKCLAKLLVVGDDFQSIYRFTGTNLDVFIDFNKYFKYGVYFYLNKTYRNSQELLNIAGDFIMKNKRQIKKELFSDISCFKPIVICYYEDDVNEIIDFIVFNFDKVMFLGRNNDSIRKLKVKNKLTVHSSKGLEFENVAIIDLEDKTNGFPNKIVSDDIFKYVLNDNDIFPYEEERRLFYVAMTRTKNKVCLCVKKSNPSIFVLELLKKDISVIYDIKHCSVCGHALRNFIYKGKLILTCDNKLCLKYDKKCTNCVNK